ncbi:hypothetical protein DSO57_1011735 [Entomophthora muscae]|uniref:Uncharacterized protein n=1 Tax=Entomophthora muscae TaxID=34485 RepID=A0ACC2T679_9FUNG|nr:hypothetical protein DSO57_1011735 [Entomophthora muscae]
MTLKTILKKASLLTKMSIINNTHVLPLKASHIFPFSTIKLLSTTVPHPEIINTEPNLLELDMVGSSSNFDFLYISHENEANISDSTNPNSPFAYKIPALSAADITIYTSFRLPTIETPLFTLLIRPWGDDEVIKGSFFMRIIKSDVEKKNWPNFRALQSFLCSQNKIHL